MKEECIFCKIASGKIKQDKVYENTNFIAFYDIKPVVDGHTLIIPRKHFNSLIDLDKEISEEYINIIQKVAKILMKKHNADGFNIILNNGKCAGQIVGHLHFHLIPRKEKDNKKLTFTD